MLMLFMDILAAGMGGSKIPSADDLIHRDASAKSCSNRRIGFKKVSKSSETYD